jgi:hypothetical protein
MKQRRRFHLTLILGLSLAGTATAQTPAPTPFFPEDQPCPTQLPNADAAEEAFSNAAKFELKQTKDLIIARGIPFRRYTGVRSPELNQLTRRLDNSPTLGLLFYSYSELKLSSWLITQCGIEAYATKSLPRSALDDAVVKLRMALKIGPAQAGRSPRMRGVMLAEDEPVRSHETTENAIRQVSELLLPSSFRQPLSRLAYLEIVPTAGLGMIPFGLLKPFGTDAYLVDRLAFSVAASLADVDQYLRTLRILRYDSAGRVRESTSLQSPVVIGNPAFPEDPEFYFPPLRGAEVEAIQIASMLGTKPLLRDAATKKAVLSAVKNSTFIYLATHGVADPSDAVKKSFVALASANYRWTAQEIQTSKFPNALVVLSACQTGLGQVNDAGIIGIARAFQIAGADVVVSLWNVDDGATVDLMTTFVENAKRETQSDALRDAMLAARRIHPDPRLWAPFIIFGNVW